MGEAVPESDPTRPARRKVRLKRPDYQPSKAELDEEITVPEGVTADDLLRSVLQPVEIEYED
ncbi:MAG: hypothetical protein OXC29_08395 [Rhodococcus sp.]|nr:hypothetical protein [Rhodococcus sp. (in: high G+C Gram-positive bacteria)]